MAGKPKCANPSCDKAIGRGRRYCSRECSATHGRAIARERRAAGLPWKRTEERDERRAGGRVVKGTYRRSEGGKADEPKPKSTPRRRTKSRASVREESRGGGIRERLVDVAAKIMLP